MTIFAFLNRIIWVILVDFYKNIAIINLKVIIPRTEQFHIISIEANLWVGLMG